MTSEITAAQLDPARFIDEQVAHIREIVGNGTAINALSGGVDSSVVTMLGHRALGRRLRTVFIDNGLVRDGRREFGQQIEIRCWDSVDARTAAPSRLPFELLESMAADILRDVPGVVSVTYNIAPKPPSAIEAV